ncbi:MAG: dihydrolipoamide acetyltransferase family protein [Polyangiales bacterium]
MAKIIELPKLSPTMEEGTLVRWAKQEGDAIDIDDLLAEVETDKATMEFRSFDRGTLLKRLVPEGAVVRLGAPVAIFGAPGEDVSGLGVASAPAPVAAPAPPAAPVAAPVAAPLASGAKTIPPQARVADLPPPPAVRGERGVAGAILTPSSPRVRRLAREADIDLGGVRGSGPHGRVVEADLSAPPAPGPDVSAIAREGDVVSDASSMRRTIARRLVESKQTVPHFYLEVDLDVGPLMELRERINAAGAPDVKVSVNDLLIRACALSLRAVPEANASWVGGKVVRYGRVDISVAVAIDDGLLTPVVRGADGLTVSAISAAVRDLAGRARVRKLKPEEMQGGTFSISNLGMMGIDRFAAVINPPESMILAVGAVRDVPVVRDGAVVHGRRCAVTLSCDHRVVDGALGARWLQSLRALVENPLRILA